MRLCSQCGNEISEQARFCRHCGRPVEATRAPVDGGASVPTARPATPPPPHYEQARPALLGGYGPGWQPSALYGYPAPAAPPPVARFNLSGLLFGDWAGAFVAVTQGMVAVAAIVLLLLLSSLGQPGAVPTGSLYVGLTAMYTAMAFGGSVHFSGAAGESTASLSFQLLGPSVVGYALIGLVFVRRLRRAGTPTPVGAVLQASRCLVLVVAELLAVVLLSHVGTTIGRVSVHADVVSTLFFGALTLVVVLTVASILGLRGMRPARAERVRAVIAGPLRAVLVLLVMSMVASFIAVLILVGQQIGGDPIPAGPAWRSVAEWLVLLLPNIAAVGLLFGLGVPVSYGLSGSPTAFGAGAQRSVTVLDLVDRGGLYWLWPLIAVLLLVGTGYLAGRWSPPTANGRSTAPMLGAVLPAVLLVLALMSSGTLGGTFDVVPVGVDGGINIALTVVFGAIWGLLAGLLGMVMAGRRPVSPAPVPVALGHPARDYLSQEYPSLGYPVAAERSLSPYALDPSLPPYTPNRPAPAPEPEEYPPG